MLVREGFMIMDQEIYGPVVGETKEDVNSNLLGNSDYAIEA